MIYIMCSGAVMISARDGWKYGQELSCECGNTGGKRQISLRNNKFHAKYVCGNKEN